MGNRYRRDPERMVRAGAVVCSGVEIRSLRSSSMALAGLEVALAAWPLEWRALAAARSAAGLRLKKKLASVPLNLLEAPKTRK